MKTNFTDPDYARKVAMMQQQSLNVFPPAILYTKAKTKIDSKTDIVKDEGLAYVRHSQHFYTDAHKRN